MVEPRSILESGIHRGHDLGTHLLLPDEVREAGGGYIVDV
jgi:hypothetical protein